jgi:isocitrate dehydrogenase
VHGSAPSLAGTDTANPSGLLLAALMMLEHIDQHEAAQRIRLAWLRTLEDGIHTQDIFDVRQSSQCAGTKAFADEVIARLGGGPRKLQLRSARIPQPRQHAANEPSLKSAPAAEKQMVGVDVFLHWRGASPQHLAQSLMQADHKGFALSMITNRGVKVWPDGMAESACTDHWRCRFVVANDRDCIEHDQITELLRSLASAGFDFIKLETLCIFGEEPGYSMGHGQ